MKCNNCECIFPPVYDSCPNCGLQDAKPERFKAQEVEIEEVEKISAIVVDGDIDDFY